MPHPQPPLTPSASTDIEGQDKSHSPSTLSFSLPPPALHTQGGSSESSIASVRSDSSYHPTGPIRPHSSRKRARPSMAQTGPNAPSTAQEFSLPPPPTRSRKIIQMKPGAVDKKGGSLSGSTDRKKSGPTSKSGPTTTAGKKTARKTAHSVIERRRRSKMNEEFDTMKEMIPACKSQTMHKLSILQAGIEYLRYLEQCVSDLQANSQGVHPTVAPQNSQSQAPTPRPRSRMSSYSDDELNEEDEDEEVEDDDDDEEDEEMEMEGRSLPTELSPSFSQFIPSSYSIQPPLVTGAVGQYGGSHSALTSPAFGPMHGGYSHSVESSPALLPNSSRDADHEATAALLMLNSDRRGSVITRESGNRPGTGNLSVQDLLNG